MSTRNRIPPAIAILVIVVVIASACQESTGPGDGDLRPEAASRANPHLAVSGDSMADLFVPPVAIVGRVVDEATGTGIDGAYVIVLRPGVTHDEWEASAGEETVSLMAGVARSDGSGRYRVEDLVRDRDYTVLIAAHGYRPAIFEEGLSLLSSDSSPTRIEPVPLQPR
ncbi:MAG: carboxypeptidase-like regulatory domain-containing protein [Gemmatimonadota bacterium]